MTWNTADPQIGWDSEEYIDGKGRRIKNPLHETDRKIPETNSSNRVFRICGHNAAFLLYGWVLAIVVCLPN